MTRRTIGETKESLEFMIKIDKLTQQQRDHMRIVVEKLIDCYIDDDKHAIVVTGSNTSDKASLLTINCDEMEAAVMLATLTDMYEHLNMADAPPKEMLN